MSMAIMKMKHPEGGEIIVPPLTWISDVASVLHTGFEPVFVDINPHTLAMDTDEILNSITERTRAVFLTHVQGFNGVTEKLVDELAKRNIPLIEDVVNRMVPHIKVSASGRLAICPTSLSITRII